MSLLIIIMGVIGLIFFLVDTMIFVSKDGWKIKIKYFLAILVWIAVTIGFYYILKNTPPMEMTTIDGFKIVDLRYLVIMFLVIIWTVISIIYRIFLSSYLDEMPLLFDIFQLIKKGEKRDDYFF